MQRPRPDRMEYGLYTHYNSTVQDTMLGWNASEYLISQRLYKEVRDWPRMKWTEQGRET